MASQELNNLDLLKSYISVFSSPEGEKVLNDLISRYMLRSSMHDNPTQVSFREGERNVVLQIIAALNLDAKTLRERGKDAKKAPATI